MNLYAIFAIYVLFWVISAFIMLPFGIRTPDETGEQLLKHNPRVAELHAGLFFRLQFASASPSA